MTEPEADVQRRRRLVWLAAGAGGFVAWALLALLPRLAQGEVVVCLFRRTTGVPCPGCGLTRAFVAMAGGDFAAALALHPLAPVIAAQIVAIWVAWGVRLYRRSDEPVAGIVAWLAVANAAALISLWGVRLASGTLPR